MNRICLTLIALVLFLNSLILQAQPTDSIKYIFALEDVIQLAKEQSLEAIMARHSFRADYFNFRAYKANYLPKLILTTNPFSYDHSIRTIQSVDEDGKFQTRQTTVNMLSSNAELSLSQNIGLTGGSVSLGSEFSREQNLDDDSETGTQYKSSPIALTFKQPLNGYNAFKWEKKIEPAMYDQAKQSYIASMEQVSSNAVLYFFALAEAQIKLNMAQTNYANSKELYELSQGRYNIGTIAEDALLQMELKYMQAESKLNSAKIDIERSLNRLRSFLGFKDNVVIQLQINPNIPNFKVSYDKALDYALTRSPDIISYNIDLLEAERKVALAKSQKGITMDLDVSFGLNKTGYDLKNAYTPRFDDREGVSIGVRVPILDWNQAKDRYRNAQSNLEVVQTRKQQRETDFRQDVYLQVMNFNMQETQLRITAKADTIAQKGYEVSRQRYLIGKVSVTDLNIADADKDEAKVDYITQLRTFWSLYFTVRRLTLFDFLNNKPLEEDFDKIVGE